MLVMLWTTADEQHATMQSQDKVQSEQVATYEIQQQILSTQAELTDQIKSTQEVNQRQTEILQAILEKLGGRTGFMEEVSRSIKDRTQFRFSSKDMNRWIDTVNGIWIFKLLQVRLPSVEVKRNPVVIEVPK